MPTSVVDKVSKKCNMSKDEAEEKWNEAKKKAEEVGHTEDWPYVMEIFKHTVGKECMKKMGWTNEDTKMETKLAKYLNEQELNEEIDFKHLKSWLKDFDSLYKEFKTDVRSKDVTGTVTSFVKLRMKVERLDKILQKAINELE